MRTVSRAICTLGLALVGWQAPRAQAAVEQLEQVEVRISRAGQLMDYEPINRVLHELRRHGEGLFRVDMKLLDKDSQQPFPQARLAIVSETVYRPFQAAPDGTLELPVLPLEQAKGSSLSSNLPKGRAHVQGTLELAVSAAELDMATVRRIVAVAQRLRSEMLPWYMRWAFPQIAGVRICSATAHWELEWREHGQLLALPLATDHRDPQAKAGTAARPCTTLTGQEAWPDHARLLAPEDSKLGVRMLGSMFGG
ncbi:hypothetical protein [Paucibacter soli]|uniref:hypothetical protein n=1 Tax=Paucibacter soli TaxID=3133433 RepID=UPI0030A2DC64